MLAGDGKISRKGRHGGTGEKGRHKGGSHNILANHVPREGLEITISNNKKSSH